MGRDTDRLVTASGGFVTPAQVVALVRPGTGSIVDFQVRQAADRTVQIAVVQRDTDTTASDRAAMVDAIARLVDPPRVPTVQRVDHITLTPGGKLRTLVTEVAGAG